MLLDEATSALDPESEDLILRSLDRLAAERTTISISHRLSTIRNSDLIVVLERGAMEDAGTHAQLLQRSVTYRQLWAAQSARSESATP